MKKIYFLSIALFILASCQEEEKKQEKIVRPVKYIEVGNSATSLNRTFSGNVKASNEIEMSFRTSGIITQLNAKVGSKVKKGDLIAQLDNVQAQLAFEQTQSALNSAKSALQTSKSQLERVKTLFEKGSSSLSDYEKAKNAYQSNVDQYESAKRNIAIKKSQIANGYIYAPKNGTITAKKVSINETANAGQVIAVLSAGNELNIETGLPESVINKIHLDMETEMVFSALEGEVYKGNIFEISPIADPNSSTYPVKISIKNPDNKIKQGMTANVTFHFDTSEKAISKNKIIVPVKTVGEDGNGNYVFVVKSEENKIGIVEKRKVTVGELTNEGFEIVQGLKEGDILITAGIHSLLDGQKVKL